MTGNATKQEKYKMNKNGSCDVSRKDGGGGQIRVSFLQDDN